MTLAMVSSSSCIDLFWLCSSKWQRVGLHCSFYLFHFTLPILVTDFSIAIRELSLWYWKLCIHNWIVVIYRAKWKKHYWFSTCSLVQNWKYLKNKKRERIITSWKHRGNGCLLTLMPFIKLLNRLTAALFFFYRWNWTWINFLLAFETTKWTMRSAVLHHWIQPFVGSFLTINTTHSTLLWFYSIFFLLFLLSTRNNLTWKMCFDGI